MNNNFFGEMDKIDQRVKAGEITGRTDFPLKGEAILFAVDTRSNNGQNFISFFLALKDNPTCQNAFDVRVPKAQDKDAGQYLGMQRIYATLHASCKKDPKNDSTSAVYAGLESFLGGKSMHVAFEIEERQTWSEKHGKNFTNQDLKSLTHIAVVPHCGLKKPAPKAAAFGGAAAQSNPWADRQNTGSQGGYKAPAIDENVPF